MSLSALTVLVLLLVVSLMPADTFSSDKKIPSQEPQISPMGAIARGDVPRPDYQDYLKKFNGPLRVPFTPLGLQGDDRLVHDPTAAGFQSENTIAVNGSDVVVGFNDIRGFGATVSVSGYAYSSDGGMTWTDGGQLPLLTGADQVYGDPDVKTWTDPVSSDVYFFYSSLYFFSSRSSLCLHVSTDGGATWSTPREVTSATSLTDFCDKEFMGVDPETGRIFISWTNFGATTTMRVTYSDDFGLTWSPAQVFNISGQGSIPRADPNSNRVYIAWRSSGAIKFVRSSDNGATWSGVMNAATGNVDPESPYGSDRIHGFPSMDVDGATGNVYIVYASRNLPPDFSDIYFVMSTDTGATWSAPAAINSNPGNDRAQFFPWVSVEQNTGRVDVIWYDQISGTGTSDLTDVFHTHSFDQGATWACPAPLTDKPFHAEYGNDTSQPNIGDYIQCVSIDDFLYASFAKTDEPSHLTYAPDSYVDISEVVPDAAPIGIMDVGFDDKGCNVPNGWLEPREFAELNITINSFTDCGTITGIHGTLSTTTALVDIKDGSADFADLLGAGATSINVDSLIVWIDSTFSCGDPIDFVLNLTSSAGEAIIPFRLWTGVEYATLLLEENFDTVTAPTLPAGWAWTPVSGTANPWVTSTTFSSTPPNAVFCADISSWSNNRLVSPVINVPADCDLLDVVFQVTHNLENYNDRRAWDGALLKVNIGGSQTELAGAFASLFDPFYPWQHLRMSGTGSNPLQDLACWSGDVTAGGLYDVHLQFPGLGGEQVKLFWELGTDNAVGTSSGMFVDDIVVTSITRACPTCSTGTAVVTELPRAPFQITAIVPNPFNPETTIRFTLPERLAVTGEVWSVSGERIRVLARDRYFDAGVNDLRWNGKNDQGETVASGVYFVRLKTRLGAQTARAVLLK
ncbi:MAG: hypothetical protein GTO51_02215 [Candidatus Latescibacteria bacterium]|nr:hypothetical protein [Candidatus Latescibacterota bacterium]NIM22428.1 hypothetical protein [Candidatus Latescibacterota bacterium]NIM64788.1 hypothetical protein [Candidatus Latescibacterota bacterium]NIO01299.1 hypothetical protein [Candidatus Latescibacterota bacterium]NIO27791.1 hypothetical protein [Candidatus Latescibacterota bacterium]